MVVTVDYYLQPNLCDFKMLNTHLPHKVRAGVETHEQAYDRLLPNYKVQDFSLVSYE